MSESFVVLQESSKPKDQKDSAKQEWMLVTIRDRGALTFPRPQICLGNALLSFLFLV